MRKRTSTTSVCLLACAALLGGCTNLDNCPDGGDDVSFDEGKTDAEALTYESSPWGEGLPHFPPNTRMRFVHDLGFTPFLVKTYVAFAPDGTADGGDGDVTESAGNQARIQCVDAREIVIENDTCEEDFYVRVVAMANGAESTDIKCDVENR